MNYQEYSQNDNIFDSDNSYKHNDNSLINY